MSRTLDFVLGAFGVTLATVGLFAAFGAVFAVTHLAFDTLKAVL